MPLIRDGIADAFKKIIVSQCQGKPSLKIGDSEAFIYLPHKTDDSKSEGLTLKILGLPLMQRILFEKIVEQGTTRVK
jgi:hypothetical protein